MVVGVVLVHPVDDGEDDGSSLTHEVYGVRVARVSVAERSPVYIRAVDLEERVSARLVVVVPVPAVAAVRRVVLSVCGEVARVVVPPCLTGHYLVCYAQLQCRRGD